MTIVMLIIGLLLAGAGLYYLSQNKNDPESRKVYGIATGIGVIVAIVSAIFLVMG